MQMKVVFINGQSEGLFLAAILGCVAACGTSNRDAADGLGAAAIDHGGADGAVSSTRVKASDVPIDGLSASDVALFDRGDAVFDLPFREADGLGPLYVRTGCGACHDGAARGPGLVQKMSVVATDGVSTAPDQSALPYGHSIREGLAAGATTKVTPPPGNASIRLSTRLGPPVLGRGYMEAIADSEIERVAREQAARTDGIHGVVNRVTFASVPNPDSTFGVFTQGQKNLIGRFGVKARIASLDEFAADAFQGDMGITSPMRPVELPNPDGLTDDLRPGVDLDATLFNEVAGYMRRIAIPVRVGLSAEGAALFTQAQCAVCHVQSLRTRKDYPIAALADVDAPVFTDMLLHDMGTSLADGMTDGSASSRMWRTAPLVGMRFQKTFLHDGRVQTAADAILAHDGEGKASADLFRGLSVTDRAALTAYVEAL
jgi:CxxC motif-containing protein (DUF1111 family)